jgi:hypothetical protein
VFDFNNKSAPLNILKGYNINPNGSASLDLMEAAKLASFKKTVSNLQPLPENRSSRTPSSK